MNKLCGILVAKQEEAVMKEDEYTELNFDEPEGAAFMNRMNGFYRGDRRPLVRCVDILTPATEYDHMYPDNLRHKTMLFPVKLMTADEYLQSQE